MSTVLAKNPAVFRKSANACAQTKTRARTVNDETRVHEVPAVPRRGGRQDLHPRVGTVRPSKEQGPFSSGRRHRPETVPTAAFSRRQVLTPGGPSEPGTVRILPPPARASPRESVRRFQVRHWLGRGGRQRPASPSGANVAFGTYVFRQQTVSWGICLSLRLPPGPTRDPGVLPKPPTQPAGADDWHGFLHVGVFAPEKFVRAPPPQLRPVSPSTCCCPRGFHPNPVDYRILSAGYRQGAGKTAISHCRLQSPPKTVESHETPGKTGFSALPRVAWGSESRRFKSSRPT